LESGIVNEFNKLIELVIPTSMKTLKTNSIIDCPKLQRLEIPNSMDIVEKDVIVNCTSLKMISTPLRFMNQLPKEQIVELNITHCEKIIEEKDFDDLTGIESLSIPEESSKDTESFSKMLPKFLFHKCPKLVELTCSASLLGKLDKDLQELLDQYHDDGKEPNPMAKSMSWMKTNMKLVMNESDHTIADLITDGCNMGVKSLNKYLNEYKAADEKSKDICKRLINLEEDLTIQMRQFL
jgi:hypothetical protein